MIQAEHLYGRPSVGAPSRGGTDVATKGRPRTPARTGVLSVTEY